MAIERVIKCDIKGCTCRTDEKSFGIGFEGGWGQVKGVALNGVIDPVICPGHMAMMMDHIDSFEGVPILRA